MRHTAAIRSATVCLALSAALVACDGSSPEAGDSGVTPPPGAARPTPNLDSKSNLSKQLEALDVGADHPMKGYSRARFPHWSNAAAMGFSGLPNPKMDSRQAVLFLQGTDVKVSGTKIVSGTWVDPWLGKAYTKPSDIDIDHHVPLAEAWRSGADAWDDTKREKYANNPDVLIATEDRQNQAKGDKDPAKWKPANKDSYCGYAQRWIEVKTAWKLTVDQAEKTALAQMVESCPK